MEPRREPTIHACPECLAAYEDGFAVCTRDGRPLVAYAIDPLVGRELERYRIEAVIGAGAMGRVYRAQHTRMSRQFALKLMYGNLAADARMRKRFAREAEAASRLSHPNLITVVDVGETATGLPYLAMDLVEGPSLADVIAREGPLGTERVVAIARGMLRGLAHAHARGLVHRDLKPANVLLAREGDEEVPRIVDFGLALVAGSAVGRVTTASLVFGTPEYMAPEQAHGDDDVDARADLFALGIILFEMLTGVLPFGGAPLEIMHKNASTPPPSMAERAPHVHVNGGLEAVVTRLMAKARDARHPDAFAVLEALDVAVPGGREEPRSATATATGGGVPARIRAGSEPTATAVAAGSMAVSRWGHEVPARRGRGRAIAAVGLAGVGALATWLAVRARGEGSMVAGTSTATPASPSAAPSPSTTPSPTPTPGPSSSPTPGPTPSSSPTPGPSSSPTPSPTPSSSPTPSPKPRARTNVRDVAPSTTSTPPAAAPIGAEDLVARYRRLGERLDALAKGAPGAAAPLRARYFAIPLADALRRPELRGEIAAAIGALERQVADARPR